MSNNNPYYDEYSPNKPPDSKIVALVEQILSWRQAGLMLYPVDAFNMLIDHSLIKKVELEEIIYKNTKSLAKLPNQHLQ